MVKRFKASTAKNKKGEIKRMLFSDFAEKTVCELRLQGKLRTAETYEAALRSLSRFCNGKEIRLNEFGSGLIERYEAYLKSRGLTLNTISFYYCPLKYRWQPPKTGLVPIAGISPKWLFRC